jgi:hypothetical protein
MTASAIAKPHESPNKYPARAADQPLPRPMAVIASQPLASAREAPKVERPLWAFEPLPEVDLVLLFSLLGRYFGSVLSRSLNMAADISGQVHGNGASQNQRDLIHP